MRREFGRFTGTSVQRMVNLPHLARFLIEGDWTPGTFSGFSALDREIRNGHYGARLRTAPPE
jgi:hypothetical protein